MSARRVVLYWPTNDQLSSKVDVLKFRKAVSDEDHITVALADLHGVVCSIKDGHPMVFTKDVEDLLDQAAEVGEEAISVEIRAAKLAEDVGKLKD